MEPFSCHAAYIFAFFFVEFDTEFVSHLALFFESQLLETIVEHILPVYGDLESFGPSVFEFPNLLAEVRPLVVKFEKIEPFVYKDVETLV